MEWKKKKKNECLLLKGARQVGKTFSARTALKPIAENGRNDPETALHEMTSPSSAKVKLFILWLNQQSRRHCGSAAERQFRKL